jgi:hypothetical protein
MKWNSRMADRNIKHKNTKFLAILPKKQLKQKIN